MKKLKKILSLVFPIFSILVFGFVVKNIRISRFSCRSQYGECSLKLSERLNSLGQCDLISCKRKIRQAFSNTWLVDEYSWQIRIPLEIEVKIIEKKPDYRIKSKNEDFYAYVDQEGLVLDSGSEKDLPGYLLEGNLPKAGEKVTESQLFALQLVKGTAKIREIKEASYQDSFLSLKLKDGKKLFLPTDGDRDFILGALTLILNELKKSDSDSRIDKEEVREIDLRYNNPIIR